MRITFVSSMCGLPWGGSEALWSQAALRLRADGHEVSASMNGLARQSPKASALSRAGIGVFYRALPGSSLPARLVNRLLPGRLINLVRDGQGSQWLRRQRPDLVLVSQGDHKDGLDWMHWCRAAGFPYACVVQCHDERWWPQDPIREALTVAYRAARQVFCVSRHALQLLELQLGTSLPQARVVCNPYGTTVGDPPDWPAEDGTWRLACVARMDVAAKGHDLLLQVLAEPAWKERPLVVNLYGAGACEGGVRGLADYLGLKNLVFRGHVDDITGVWKENHLLVLPSRYEGTPLALLEAMWSARPAVVTAVGGSPEVCVDAETGFLASAPTLGALRLAMERAWQRRTEWRSMGQAARAHAAAILPPDPVGEFCELLLTPGH